MLRQDRLQEAIKREVSLIIHDELKDPRLGFITITKVELTADYRLARVFYSVLGGESEYKKCREALDSGLGFIRRLVGRRIKMRFTPEILFKEDRSSQYSVQIQKILDEIKAEDLKRGEENTRSEKPEKSGGDGA
ncbi:MAG: 30S ribosome-binding factor RbfA [Candidatus Omnitrophica bacterium]|nr:30S ribosome-binding factor RbfA [Candidatus Omnitrophota bacterium]